MNIKTPFTPHLTRGAYSAIVFKDGDLYVAEGADGHVIIENTDAATTIQKAIDDYAENGFVLIKPPVTLSSTLKILKSNSNIEFLDTISSSGVKAFEIGDAANNVESSVLKMAVLDGVNKAAHGIEFKNATICQFYFRQIQKCDIGLYFNPSSGGLTNENVIAGAHMGKFNTAAIRFAANSVEWMEGNHFQTSIFEAPIGFDLLSGGNSRYQTFIGVIDCAGTSNSEDIKDAVGRQFFLCDFVRRSTCTIHKKTLLINVYGANEGNSAIEQAGGTLDFLNVGFTPFISWNFNRDSTADWTHSNCTMGTPSKSVTRLTATGVDPYIRRYIELDGGQAPTIIVRYKYISGGISEVMMYYSTAGHGYSGSYNKNAVMTTDGEWHIMVFDMNDLTVGGSDWIDNIITGLRFDFSASIDTVVDIDYIAIGGSGYASIYHMDDALKTPASASAQGNKGDIRWDANYLYICTSMDTWKRQTLNTW
jgi:hypothetical protein